MEENIREYRLDCPAKKEKVSPLVCRQCDKKEACTAVNQLDSEETIKKWKGTLLENGMNVVLEFRKKVKDFILSNGKT